MRRIGVCSWSLRPHDAADLAARARRCGVLGVQLALDPIRDGRWDEAETRATLNETGIEVLSGMMAMEGEDYSTLESIRRTGGVRMDATWERNLAAAAANAQIASRLGLKLVTFHAGFLPHNRGDAERARMVERLRRIADAFAAHGVAVAFETGQETADTLVGVLAELERPSVGVNFDPANMILYGMGEPVAALERLAPFVKQVHIKDAVPTKEPGQWGRELPVGRGVVDWEGFFAVLRAALPRVDLVIEREAGEGREADVVAARELVERHLKGEA